jgi:hypothetical protein
VQDVRLGLRGPVWGRWRSPAYWPAVGESGHFEADRHRPPSAVRRLILGDAGARSHRLDSLLVPDEENTGGLEVEPTVSRDRPAGEFKEGFSAVEVRQETLSVPFCRTDHPQAGIAGVDGLGEREADQVGEGSLGSIGPRLGSAGCQRCRHARCISSRGSRYGTTRLLPATRGAVRDPVRRGGTSHREVRVWMREKSAIRSPSRAPTGSVIKRHPTGLSGIRTFVRQS